MSGQTVSFSPSSVTGQQEQKQKTECQSRSLTQPGLSKQLRNQIVKRHDSGTKTPELSKWVHDRFLALSYPSFPPPTHLSIISPLDLHSPQPPWNCSSSSTPAVSFSSTFVCFSLPLSLLSSHSSHPLFLSLPTFPSTDAFIILSQSVRYTSHPQTHTHSPLISRQPKPHLTLVNAAIERLLIYAYRCSVCVLLFTLLNVTCSLASQLPFTVCVSVCISQKKLQWVLCACCLLLCVCVFTCQACSDWDGEGVAGLLVCMHNHPHPNMDWRTGPLTKHGTEIRMGQRCDW